MHRICMRKAGQPPQPDSNLRASLTIGLITTLLPLDLKLASSHSSALSQQLNKFAHEQSITCGQQQTHLLRHYGVSRSICTCSRSKVGQRRMSFARTALASRQSEPAPMDWIALSDPWFWMRDRRPYDFLNVSRKTLGLLDCSRSHDTANCHTSSIDNVDQRVIKLCLRQWYCNILVDNSATRQHSSTITRIQFSGGQPASHLQPAAYLQYRHRSEYTYGNLTNGSASVPEGTARRHTTA